MEQGRFRAVEIFGLALAEDATAEADRAATALGNGEHHPVAKAVVRAALAFFGADQQAGFDEKILGKAGAGELCLQAAAALWRKAQTETGHRRFLEATTAQVRQRRLALGQPQALLIPRGRRRDRFFETVAPPLDGLRFRRRVGQAEPGLGSECTNGLDEAQVLRLHDEIEYRAVLAAAEAVVESLLVVDGERRRFFLMKRAQAEKFPPVPLESDAPADDIGQPQPCPQLIKESGGKAHRSPAGRWRRPAGPLRPFQPKRCLTSALALTKSICPA